VTWTFLTDYRFWFVAIVAENLVVAGFIRWHPWLS
jgi:hypothetical protein